MSNTRYVKVTGNVRCNGVPLRGYYGALLDARMPRGPETKASVRLPTFSANTLGIPRKYLAAADAAVAEAWIDHGGDLIYDPKKRALPLFADRKRSSAQDAIFVAQAAAMADVIKELRRKIGFSPSVRGWCYLAEEHFNLGKGEFDSFQRQLVQMRKDGLLPLDIVAEDEARQWGSVEDVHPDESTHAENLTDWLEEMVAIYNPVSFWDDKGVYIQLWVEKIDLREMWRKIAREFRIPIANARGWSDLHCRAAMMERFKEHEAAGREVVLLYCGDHDPAGLNISEHMRSNLEEMAGAIGWTPKNLHIDRFGLNHDFIEEHRLPWIENLETGSGRSLADRSHPDHGKPYVQNYLKRFGGRKVEANALVIRPDAGRKLLLDTIGKYIDADAPKRHDEAMKPFRADMMEALRDSLEMRFH